MKFDSIFVISGTQPQLLVGMDVWGGKRSNFEMLGTNAKHECFTLFDPRENVYEVLKWETWDECFTVPAVNSVTAVNRLVHDIEIQPAANRAIGAYPVLEDPDDGGSGSDNELYEMQLFR